MNRKRCYEMTFRNISATFLRNFREILFMTNSVSCKPAPQQPIAGRTAGFTLVEVLTVMLIVVALAAISIPLYGTYIDKAKTTLAKGTLATTRTVLEDYHTEYQSYPQTIDFSSGLDGSGKIVLPQSLVDDFVKNIFAVDSYSVNGDYILKVRAKDKNHTLFTLTAAQGIVQEP
jgi:prepilin-type N-terminal cleavage/methylation domain-containing protein